MACLELKEGSGHDFISVLCFLQCWFYAGSSSFSGGGLADPSLPSSLASNCGRNLHLGWILLPDLLRALLLA